jgi:hypothetical protein
MFKEMIAQEGIKSKMCPSLDVTTCWNSTFLMLERVVALRKAFDSLELQDHKYTFAPSFEEWQKANVLCRVLKEFYDITELIFGSKYPTSNLYFYQMWKIKILLEKENSEEVAVEVSYRLKVMKKKFTKYWKKSYISLCVLAIFYPRYKLKFIEFLFMDSFPTTTRSKLNRLESLVKQIFLAYPSPSTNVSVGPSQMDGANYDMPATQQMMIHGLLGINNLPWICKLKCPLILINIWMRISFQDLRNLIYCTGGGAIVLSTQSYLT